MDSRGMPCARARGAWRVPFEGTQAIVSLQLLTCLRRFQVILKYCRTTQARYFAMTSSREPSREPGERTDDPVRMYLREMVQSSFCPARAKSRSQSASRPAARR
jgi:hypothetical protein